MLIKLNTGEEREIDIDIGAEEKAITKMYAKKYHIKFEKLDELFDEIGVYLNFFNFDYNRLDEDDLEEIGWFLHEEIERELEYENEISYRVLEL